ncbi:MAG: protein jag [Spirochaetaceae bacterium]|nr:protein jag [Spirochaetaceae bacterium]
MVYEYEGKTEKEAIEMAAAELGLERDQFDVEIIESQKTGFFKKGFVRIRVHTVDTPENVRPELEAGMPKVSQKLFADPLPQDDFERQLINFTASMIRKMGYDVTVEIMFREDHKLGMRLNSSKSSILIGRKGKNLDALQLLVNVYAGRLGREDIRIILDTENYRIRREESLVRLAYTVADKVRMNHRSMLLEPMNPFERRLIHTTLNDISDVETKSEGDGLYKQVRIIYKGVR